MATIKIVVSLKLLGTSRCAKGLKISLYIYLYVEMIEKLNNKLYV